MTERELRRLGGLSMNPVTPDGRYFVVKGQLWRCSNSGLDEGGDTGCR